jgi:hypothetical protein
MSDVPALTTNLPAAPLDTVPSSDEIVRNDVGEQPTGGPTATPAGEAADPAKGAPRVKKKTPKPTAKRPEAKAEVGGHVDKGAIDLDRLFAKALSSLDGGCAANLISDLLPGMSGAATSTEVPGAVIMAFLPALASCASHAVAIGGGEGGIERPLSLRTAVIGTPSAMIAAIAPSMQALYGVESDEVDAWEAAAPARSAARAVQAAKAKLAAQAVIAAAVIGMPLEVRVPGRRTAQKCLSFSCDVAKSRHSRRVSTTLCIKIFFSFN